MAAALTSVSPASHPPPNHSLSRTRRHVPCSVATPQITAQKIRIANSADTYKAMLEFIDEEHIPVEYGGKLSYGPEPDACR